MTESKPKRRRKRRPRTNGFDVSLLPQVIQDHYGPGIDGASAEVLLAAWSWYERGRADALVMEVAGLRQVVTQGLARREVVGGATGLAGKSSVIRVPWTPKAPTFPPGHGQVYDPDDLPPEAAPDAMLDDYEAATIESERLALSEVEVDPKYGAIGHYSADVITPIVRHAEAISKNPIFGVKVARDLLADGEQRCQDPPSGIVGQIEAKLRAHNMLRGEDWSKMENV